MRGGNNATIANRSKDCRLHSNPVGIRCLFFLICLCGLCLCSVSLVSVSKYVSPFLSMLCGGFSVFLHVCACVFVWLSGKKCACLHVFVSRCVPIGHTMRRCFSLHFGYKTQITTAFVMVHTKLKETREEKKRQTRREGGCSRFSTWLFLFTSSVFF